MFSRKHEHYENKKLFTLFKLFSSNAISPKPNKVAKVLGLF